MFPGQLLLSAAVILICAEKPMTPFKKAGLIFTIFSLILSIGSAIIGVE